MRWAAVILVALSALCVPAAARAEDEAFTEASVRKALDRFGDHFIGASCLAGVPTPFRIAVVQMEDSTKFLDDEAQIITERIEQALAANPRYFDVKPRRDSWVLQNIAKAFGEAKSRGPSEQLHALIVIRPEGGHSVNVIAYALASGSECVITDQRIKIGRIDKDPDVPSKLFEHAAGRLFGGNNDHRVERLVVMPPEIVGFNGMAGRIMGRRLQEQMINAINKIFQDKANLSMTGVPVRSVAGFYNGTDVTGAWQGYLYLSRSSEGLIAVRIDFRGPTSEQGGTADSVSDHGYFGLNILPTDSDPEVVVCNRVGLDLDRTADPATLQVMIQRNECSSLRDDIVKKEALLRAQAICKRVQLELDAATDPAALEGLAQRNECASLHDAILEKVALLKNQAVCDRVRLEYERSTDLDILLVLSQKNECPGLHNAIVAKEARLRQQICDDDRAHWKGAVSGSLQAMESMLATLRCQQVRDAAEGDIRSRREHEAEIERLKAAAADLGVLQGGETAERNGREGGDDVVGVWKFQMTETDTVEIQVDDPDGTLTVELRDASWRVIATARPSGPRSKGIEARLASSVYPATYYIQVAPADRKRNAAYTLRAARGFIDGIGNTPNGARDLGSLGQVPQTIRKHIGGSDRGDFFRFTAKERSQLNVTVGDLTSDVHIDLLNQNLRTVETWSYKPGRQPPNTTPIVEAGTVYYLSVVPVGPVTPYALGIALSPSVAILHANQSEAADVEVGGAAIGYTLPASQSSYWARFHLSQGANFQIVLQSTPQNALRLSLMNDRGRVPAAPGWTIPGNGLTKGDYWVLIERVGGGTGNVPFVLSLQRR